MTGSQTWALVALRWRMVRSIRARVGFGLLACAVPVLGAAAVAVGVLLPREQSFDVLVLAPTAYLSVAVLAVLAPLVAGGGNELFPAEQLTAYPVSSRTQYVVSVLLAPLNLAWTVQLVGLLGVTAFGVGPGPLLPLALVTTLLYVGLVTVAGQALAWLVVGVRQTDTGRRLTWAAAAAVAAAALAVVLAGRTTVVLDAAPTTAVVTGAVAGAGGRLGRWALTTGLLLLLLVSADRLGRRAADRALRLPGGPTVRIDAHQVRRRRGSSHPRRELLAIDRASVWRSPSLRRGLLVLALLPGAAAAAARLDWSSLVLLPGLVAAGAGLLFGVNAFCLDGTGAVWLASLPGHARPAFWSKVQVVAETCVVAIAITVAAGVLRADSRPAAPQVSALAACAVVALVRVVALCMDLSVRHPHRADLRGPRDTPAPPGVMAAYSARLAVSTTLVAVLFSALAQVASWEWPVLVAVPFVLLGLRRLLRAATAWQDTATRGRVLMTVAAG